VSVVLPVRDAGAFLRPAVLSVLAARRDGLEVVVVDDGSTDGGVRSLEGLPARVLRREKRGVAAARNAGVRAAAGRFVTFLDGDDLLDARGLAPRLAHLEKNAGALAAGGLPASLIDERGETLAPVFERMAASMRFPFRLTLDDYRSARFFPVSASLYLYRREAFERAGPYDETLAAGEDADFHFRLLGLGAIPVLRVAAFARRLHGANLSLASARGKKSSFRPETLAALRVVNRRHGLAPADIVPWEADYL
jgi:glycosyltransferase involved in cell wall biosynthesis